jgi:hypothetical protein
MKAKGAKIKNESLILKGEKMNRHGRQERQEEDK